MFNISTQRTFSLDHTIHTLQHLASIVIFDIPHQHSTPPVQYQTLHTFTNVVLFLSGTDKKTVAGVPSCLYNTRCYIRTHFVSFMSCSTFCTLTDRAIRGHTAPALTSVMTIHRFQTRRTLHYCKLWKAKDD